MFDKSSEDSAVLCIAEAKQLVRSVAEPREVGDGVKAAIARSASRLRWTYSRTREIWYARAKRIDAHEMDALRREAQTQAARYESIARAMEQTDPSFYQQEIVALLGAANRIRGVADTGDDPTGEIEK